MQAKPGHSEATRGESARVKPALSNAEPSLSELITEPVARALYTLSQQAGEVELTLKGGVAVPLFAVSYLGNKAGELSLRTVSADIDWTCCNDNANVEQHLKLLQKFTPDAALSEDEEQIGSIRFSSKIARGQIGSITSPVSLDCIPCCRFAPNESGYAFEFGCIPDLDSSELHKNGLLPKNCFLNAREITIAEKLCLARGQELGKFDLQDAALLLALAPPRLEMLKVLVASQRYTVFDHAAVLRLDSLPNWLQGQGLSELAEFVVEENRGFSQDSPTPIRIKQYAFVARMLEGLSKLPINQVFSKDSALQTTLTATLPQSIEKLKLQLFEALKSSGRPVKRDFTH